MAGSVRQRMALAGVFGCALLAVGAASAPGSALYDGKAKLHGGNFFSNCRFSHGSADDPIVYPRLPGRSHRHTFFGNTSTNAFSTLASLRRAGTTCKVRADRAAYWVPTLYQNGREVRPSKAQLYYIVRGYDRMRAFPAGLRVVAGNSGAAGPQRTRVTYWACGGQAAQTAPSRTLPRVCGVIQGHGLGVPRGSKPRVVRWRTKTHLELHVTFPDCWDGKHLDSLDHRSHMAYSRQYRCPPSHPVKVPLIRLTIGYPIARGAGVSLASGGQYSGHADFFNAWRQGQLTRLVNTCLNALRHCARGD
jgi:Domain of unknown function (DUF1996)